jgi:inner membrane protein
VDPAAHALASFALARGLFPNRRWPAILGIILAGTFADIDWFSAWFGPAAYFTVRRTFTHSIPGTILVIALALLFTRYISRKDQPGPLLPLLLPLTIAAGLHVVLDLLQSEGVAVFWPLSQKRYAADCLPSFDLWILALLLAGILVPELFRLVTSEIGVKDKRPRGRNGALVALALIAAYIGGRAILHANSAAALDPHSYKGESARSVAAYPDSLSLFTWHGVVETQSYLCQVAVPAGLGKSFDPESADCLHKPEPSPELDAAQKTKVAHAYVNAVPFPRASVSKTPDGSEILLRSMRDAAENQTRHRLAARIVVDPQLKISTQELIWLSDIHIR